MNVEYIGHRAMGECGTATPGWSKTFERILPVLAFDEMAKIL